MKTVVDKFQALKKYFTLQVVNFWHLLLQETVEMYSISRFKRAAWIYEQQLHRQIVKAQGRLVLSIIPNSWSLDAGGGNRL